jgi:hypothetical protein
MMWPSLSSAAADLELLLQTCQQVASEMKQDSASSREISTLLATMYNAALHSVGQAQSFLVAGRQPRRTLAGPRPMEPLSPETYFRMSGTSPQTQISTSTEPLNTSPWPTARFEPRVRFDLGGGSWDPLV